MQTVIGWNKMFGGKTPFTPISRRTAGVILQFLAWRSARHLAANNRSCGPIGRLLASMTQLTLSFLVGLESPQSLLVPESESDLEFRVRPPLLQFYRGTTRLIFAALNGPRSRIDLGVRALAPINQIESIN
jgi:hypothetical protein